jgi:hypothetical protein
VKGSSLRKRVIAVDKEDHHHNGYRNYDTSNPLLIHELKILR